MPGMTARPPASITCVLGPRRLSTSAAEPTAAIVPPRTAIALAVGCFGLSVAIRPLVMIVSGALPGMRGIAQPPRTPIPASPAVATVSFRKSRRPRSITFRTGLRQILCEPRERFAPCGLRRLGVVALARVVVKGVVDVRIDDLAESLAVLSHRRLDRRNVLVDAVVEPRVDREDRRADSRHVRLLHRNAVERHRRAQIGHSRRD